MCQELALDVPLVSGWPKSVRSVVLHIISMAHYAIVAARGWAANSINARVRLNAQNDRLTQQVELLREQLRIKDARMARILPEHRPHYRPVERMAIVELKAAQGWTVAQTAREFLIEPATVASWLKRIDEQEPDALVQLSQPVNRFPDFVRYIVQRLKVVCPSLGKRKIAQMLARAGLHLGTTTVQRVLKEKPTKPPTAPAEAPVPTGRVVMANYPDHVHHVDLTVVPTSAGLWASWLPLALPQTWPFAWWVAVVIDHFSRRAMGVAVFKKQPTSVEVRTFLGRLYAKTKPKYIVCDKGSQFWCEGFKAWCKRRGIRPRFGAIGRYGSIAVLERFVRTLKEECTRRILVPLRRDDLRRELVFYFEWYNEYRPHEYIGGETPNEVYYGRRAASMATRVEPRAAWPAAAPCAAPRVPIRGAPGQRMRLVFEYHAGRKHLPIVKLAAA
ncbi:MAG: Integrase core domain protein [Planctomycetes bacterium ADurb.Bin126]|nr:MAG: Integrase core domain protein [Planctomycetes bacterium ADurb.Bin126]